MTCPRQRSAWSVGTPARLISDRLVLRRSWIVHPVTPQALSKSSFDFENPRIGVVPYVKIHSTPLMRGTDCSKSLAAWESGTTWSNLVLYREPGMVQSA